MSIFKACDIRGLADRELTSEVFARLGRGIARMMGGRGTIVIGGDFRPSTPALKDALMLGLAGGGCQVKDVGQTPTPLVYFAKEHLRADACAIVTASHNPPEYNGLKFMIGKWPVLPQDIERLKELVAASDTSAPTGARQRAMQEDVLPAYEKWLPEQASEAIADAPVLRRRMRVVVDAGNGAYSDIAPRVLSRLAGVEVEPLFCVPDGTFPNRDPNCAIPGHLKALADRVRLSGADLGVAFDGDGDRVAFLDERGEFVDADEVFVLLMRHIRTRNPAEKIVYDQKCSQVVAREAQRMGLQPLMERSGHAFIKRTMIAEDALLGGEVSGHYFYRSLGGGDDGLFSAIVMVRLLQRTGISLSELRKDLPRRFITKDIRISFPPERAGDLLERLRRSFPAHQLTELDGLRVALPQGWGLLRASITEPKVTLRFEGDSAEALKQTIETIIDKLPELAAPVRAAIEKG